MGRLSQNTKIVSLVDFYDYWMLDEGDITAWMNLFNKHAANVLSICELACGSGNITKELINENRWIVASDIDQAMLNQARQKINHPNVSFVLANMIDFHFKQTFDCIVSANDSVNFLTEVAQLKHFAQQCELHLISNGKVIFDIHSINRLELFKEPYVESGMINEIGYEYHIESIDSFLHHTIWWYQDSYPTQETIVQKVFTPNDIQSAFTENKWDVTFESMVDIDQNEQKLFVVATKK